VGSEMCIRDSSLSWASKDCLVTNEHGTSHSNSPGPQDVNHSGAVVSSTLPPSIEPSPTQAFRNLTRAVANWYGAGVLAAIVMPTRIPPRAGLKGTWLGRHVVTFRMKDGSRVRCRLQDAGDPISVFIDRDYERLNIRWDGVRSIVDVGSTVGSFTLWASRHSPGSTVVAVEPNPDLYPYLVENIRMNGLAHRVTVVAAALGASSGVAAVASEEPFSTRMRFVPVAPSSRPLARLLSLEDLFAEMRLERCDLLKIDCEGSEYDVLLAAPDSVLVRVETVICEYHPVDGYGPAELVTRLADVGFRVAADHSDVGFVVATRDV